MPSLGQRLYRGDLNINFVGRAKLWYKISAVLLLVCIVSMVFRGFNFGIEFEGGDSFQFPGSQQQLDQVQADVEAAGVQVGSAQVVGTDQILLRTPELDNDTSTRVAGIIGEAVGIDASDVSNSSVSPRWGSDITSKALQSLVVFLVLVSAFIALRFQPKMAVAALAALVNDLIVAAGLYSLVGFEVTPSTVIGLLTILGFSLYDTVVVFDKVDENTRGILGGSRTTYSEAANLAVNQTLMRSINTTLIALLPVAGLLFVGAGLLGAGTLKDLALVLFVGLATGAYSSIFLATPILCDLKEREPAHIALTKRVQARRASGRDVEPVVRTSKGTARGSARPPAARTKPARASSTGARTALLDKPEPADEPPASPPV
ncbi:MAG: protein translocase subunit SecF, partial [Geodermatophilaceae bacterium]|nr:protein translocase subunit SecF [Geodermatophilaceae bacterium]